MNGGSPLPFQNAPGALENRIDRGEFRGQWLLSVRRDVPTAVIIRTLVILDGQIGRVSHARKRRKARAADSPGRIGIRDPSAGTQYRMRDGELMRRRPHIHVGIMEDEILNVNKLARNPHAGGRIEEMAPFDLPLPHGTAPHGLVEACEVILLSLLLPDFKREKVRPCLGLGAKTAPIFR